MKTMKMKFMRFAACTAFAAMAASAFAAGRRGGLQRQGGERELAFGGGSGERRQTRVQDVVQTRQDARHHTRGGALFHEQG